MTNDPTPLPDWADVALSENLSIIRATGEGSTLDYVQEFPVNASKIGKEIAAFASSGGGRIVVGVADNGDLVRLGLPTARERDELVQRLEGICHGVVKPAVTPIVAFAVEQGKTVLVIDVPGGPEPIYYCSNIPYVRHLTQSRPAEPFEVVELIKAWMGGEPPEQAWAHKFSYFGAPIRYGAEELELEDDTHDHIIIDLQREYAMPQR